MSFTCDDVIVDLQTASASLEDPGDDVIVPSTRLCSECLTVSTIADDEMCR